MIQERKERFASFGVLDTWVVGTQYYEGGDGAQDREVVFERDPDNPFDANAVGVYTTDGEQLGHLPRYDAEYMSPLILEGTIALRGKTGESTRNDRVPLRLEVFATEKVQGVLDEDEANDWRAIYHNLFVQVWLRLDHYSAAAIEAFRNRFRNTAHNETLYPKTQFLYRMLKAHIEQMKQNEIEAWKERLNETVDGFIIGAPLGWHELAVFPLFASGTTVETPPSSAGDSPAAKDVAKLDRESGALSALPRRCPYPPGAAGALILVHNTFYRLEWFDHPGECEVYWFAMCTGAMDLARIPVTDDEDVDAAEHTRESVKQRVQEMVADARCRVTDTEESPGLQRIQLVSHGWSGYAQWRDQRCIRVALRCNQAKSEDVS